MPSEDHSNLSIASQIPTLDLSSGFDYRDRAGQGDRGIRCREAALRIPFR